MRYVWLTFLSLVAGLLAFVGWRHFHGASPAPLELVAAPPTAPAHMASLITTSPLPQADSLIHFAMQQLGSPYTYAGTTPTGGFDCSGFLLFVYGHFGIPVPHSTALLISTGRPVPREQARRGDMVVFTGTAATSTTPGHAGIVISEPGEPLRFIHSSSARRESGVKISQVEGTDYERRFLGIRRVLGEKLPATAAPAVPEPETKMKVKTKSAAGSSKYKALAPVRR